MITRSHMSGTRHAFMQLTYVSLHLHFLKLHLFTYLCVCVGVHVPQHMCGGQRAICTCLFFSFIRVSGTQFHLPGLAASTYLLRHLALPVFSYLGNSTFYLADICWLSYKFFKNSKTCHVVYLKLSLSYFARVIRLFLLNPSHFPCFPSVIFVLLCFWRQGLTLCPRLAWKSLRRLHCQTCSHPPAAVSQLLELQLWIDTPGTK